LKINYLLIVFLAVPIASCTSQSTEIYKKENSKFAFFDKTTETDYQFKIDKAENVVVLSYDVKNQPVCMNSDSAVYNQRLKFEKRTGKTVEKISSEYSGLNAFLASEFGSSQIKILIGKGEIILDIGNKRGNYSFYILNFVNCKDLWNGPFTGTKFFLEIPE
jgi:hypothetical protein